MSPEEIGRRQQAKIDRLTKNQDQLRDSLTRLDAERARDAAAIKELKVGSTFRDLLRRAAASIVPFRQIIQVPLPANSTQRVAVPQLISTNGWFIAKYVWISWMLTGGSNPGRFMPLCSSDAIIATAATPPADRLEFMWEYSEDVTGRTRQSQGQVIPGDLAYRHGDSFGWLLQDGDAWHPVSTITVAVTPTVAPPTAGTVFFTFLGEQCLQTQEAMLDQWITRKAALGI